MTRGAAASRSGEAMSLIVINRKLPEWRAARATVALSGEREASLLLVSSGGESPAPPVAIAGSRDGELAWRLTGRDVFSGSFRILGDVVEAVDFSGLRYRIKIPNGQVEHFAADGTRLLPLLPGY